MSDGSCFHPVQVVAPNTLPNYADESCSSPPAARSRSTGNVVPSPAKGQPFEVQASRDRGRRLGRGSGHVSDPAEAAHDGVPARGRAPAAAHQRDRRGDAACAHTLAQAIHRFFHEHGFFWINTPIITASDAEGAGEMFRVSTLDLANLPRTPDGKVDFAKDFFGREAFLTVSGQLNVETYCMALSKVYTFGPTFRAENSNTSRHLAEFWMIEPEIAFADLADDATLAEAFLKHVFRTVLDERADDMAFFEERIEKGVIAKLQGIVDSEFVRMDYTEAIARPREGEAEVRVPGEVGHRPAVASTSAT